MEPTLPTAARLRRQGSSQPDLVRAINYLRLPSDGGRPGSAKSRAVGSTERSGSAIYTTGGKLGTVIKRVQTVLVVLTLVVLGFVGTQPAFATQTEPGPGMESPAPGETEPPIVVEPPVVVPSLGPPAPTTAPSQPETPPSTDQPVAPAPAPPVIKQPVAPPAVAPEVTAAPAPEAPVETLPTQQDAGEYLPEPEVPAEAEPSAVAVPTPEQTPTPTPSKAAAPVASADIAGPLKAAIAPVAENSPLVQGITVLVLILLGVAYFRALRSKGAAKPRLSGK